MADNVPKDSIEDGIKDFSQEQLKILKSLEQKPTLTAQELSEIIGINKRNIENNLAQLKKEGILVRVGSRKFGYWKIVEK